MTIQDALQKMQQGKKISHKKLGFKIQYLTIMLGSDIIDNSGNNQNRLFESLKNDVAFASDWTITDIEKVF